MKKFKQLACFFLAIAMVLTLGVTAFAADTQSNGKITINNAVKGQTYTIYRIFDLESYNADSNAYSYKVNDTWEDWVTKQTEYVKVNDQGYVTWVKDANAEEFAKLALQHAKENPIANDGQKTATGEPVVFNQLPLGYYLVDSSLGALCSLDTTNSEVIIKEKNTAPTIDKQVQEDSNQKWGKENDADIGQTVKFTTTVHAKKGAENYVVHDKMSAGLTLQPESIKVKDLTKGHDYTVNTEDLTDDCTFEIIFTKNYLNTITEDKNIIITYSAVLNENAVIAEDVNTNDTKLSYGDNNSTEWDRTKTKTYQFQLVKTDNNNTVLDGAEFELYDAKTDGNKIQLVDLNDGTYRVATAEEAAEDFNSAVIKAGQATIQGLDGSTTYYLQEIKAPDGYNKLAKRVAVKIDQANLDATVDESNIYKTGGVHVINQTGAKLPSTGGMGTTLFYVLGGILVTAAVVLLVTKKRMHNHE